MITNVNKDQCIFKSGVEESNDYIFCYTLGFTKQMQSKYVMVSSTNPDGNGNFLMSRCKEITGNGR